MDDLPGRLNQLGDASGGTEASPPPAATLSGLASAIGGLGGDQKR